MTDLVALNQKLAAAVSPEEVFGTLSGATDEMLGQIRKSFRAMAMIAHPDRSPADPRLAEQTFNRLETWRQRAEERICSGLYGTAARGGAMPIVSRRGTYGVGRVLQQGDYFTLYRCTRSDPPFRGELFLKIARSAAENDLIEREVERLQSFQDMATDDPPLPLLRYIPELVDSFLAASATGNRRAVIFGTPKTTLPMTAIRAAYPAGLDPRDAAWIFNRLLEALWYLHRAGTIHGAVLPPNLWIDIENHGLRLAEWASATTSGEPLSIVGSTYAAWYPKEVFAKQPAGAATDIYMAARCFIELLGGDVLACRLPANVPAPIKRFINGCLVPWSIRRPNDAGELREEFGSLLKTLYGKPAFRPLAIPA